MLNWLDVLVLNYGRRRDKMKNYIVSKKQRIGIANFKITHSVMSEEQVKMSFPTWDGSKIHKSGRYIYEILLISPEI